MDDLVQRLSKPGRVITVSRAESPGRFKEQIDRGYVLIKFVETQGGTELGYKLDEQYSDFVNGDFESGSGIVTIAGELTLNYVRVRCVAKVDLTSLEGMGYLEVLNDD